MTRPPCNFASQRAATTNADCFRPVTAVGPCNGGGDAVILVGQSPTDDVCFLSALAAQLRLRLRLQYSRRRRHPLRSDYISQSRLGRPGFGRWSPPSYLSAVLFSPTLSVIVCQQNNPKSYGWFFMKFGEWVAYRPEKGRLNFGRLKFTIALRISTPAAR